MKKSGQVENKVNPGGVFARLDVRPPAPRSDEIDTSPVFTVTSFNLKKERKKGNDWEAVEYTRCVGYYHEFEKAEKAVLGNVGDIHEAGYYSHVVIEQVEPGLYPVQALDHRWFYKWTKDKYVKCRKFDDPRSDVISYAPIG